MYREKYDAARALDRVAIDFERQYVAGGQPRIEEFVRDHPEVDSAELVSELLAIEIELRRGSGEHPSASEYENRLSEFPAVVETCFAQSTMDEEEPTVAPVYVPEEPAFPTIDGYDILEKVGEGGMGTVYRARQESPNRIVAIKTIRSGALAAVKEHVRFRAETEAVARLDHPNIVPLLSVGEADGLPYLTMPFVAGATLSRKVSDGTFKSHDAAVFIQMLADAVAHAHSRQLIHRDIKPGNVLVTPTGIPRLTDFGLVSDTGTDERLTRTGEVLGTPSFMSPEQARGTNEAVGVCSDIYAIGAVLYFMLTGKPPHQGTTPLETLSKVLNDDVVRPRVIDRSITKDIETICLKCLKKAPTERYRSAVALSEDLQRYINGHAITARPDGVIRRVTRWGLREPWRAGALGLLILVIIGSFGGVVAYSDYQRLEQEKQVQSRIDADRRFVDDDRAKLSTAIEDHLLVQRVMDFSQRGDLISAQRALVVMSQQGLLRRYLERRVATVHGGMVKVDHWQAGNWPVQCSAESPDGSQILCADHGGQLLLRDLQLRSSRLIRDGFSDGKGDYDHWVVKQRRPEAERGDEPLFVSIKWPEPDLVYVATLDGKIASFDPTETTPAMIEIVNLNQRLHCMDYNSEDGGLLVGAADGTVIRVLPDRGRLRTLSIGKKAVTAIYYWQSEDVWLVGDDGGTVSIVDSTGGKVLDRANVGERVWSLSANAESKAAAGTNSGPILLVMRKDNLRVFDRLQSASSESVAAHEVLFSDDGRKLLSGGPTLRLGLWDVATRRLEASWGDSLSDKRLPPKLRRQLPIPLQRHVGGIHIRSDDLIAVTDHAGIFEVLELDPSEDALPFHQSKASVGDKPDVFFGANGNHIWTLSSHGRLSLVDPETLEIRDSIDAHRPASADGGSERTAEIRSAGENMIVTVARSKAIRFWVAENSKIKEVRNPAVSGPAAILSVDVCVSQNLIAAVDARAHLLVWELKSGRKLFDQRVHGSDESGGPTVGVVRFNSAGTRVAVTGSMQATHVYDTSNFAVIRDAHLRVAGRGAMDLEWSTERDMLVTHDSLKGSLVYQSDQRLASANGRNANLRRLLNGVDSTATFVDNDAVGPDGFVTLYDSGTVVFHSADHHVPVGQITTPVKTAHSVAMNQANTQLVIADVTGTLTSLSLATESQELPTEIRSIDVQPVLTSATSLIVSEFGLGSDGSAHFCVFEIPREIMHGGKLSLAAQIRTENSRWQVDPVQIEPGDRWAMANGGGTVVIREPDRTQLIYRRKRPDLGQYVFDLILAEKRTARDDWSYERIVKNLNAGQNVVPYCDENGSVTAIAHMTPGNYHGLVSLRGDQGEHGWSLARLGSRRCLSSGVRVGDSIHGLVGIHRIPADPLPPRYAVWDGRKGIEEVALPKGVRAASLYQLLNGTPLIRLTWLNSARPSGWYVRSDHGWDQHFRDRGTVRDQFEILESGELAKVGWGSQKKVLNIETDKKRYSFQIRGVPGKANLGCGWVIAAGRGPSVVVYGEAQPGEWKVWYGESEKMDW